MPENRAAVSYGLIGAGMMGQEHMRNLSLIEGAQLVALADPDPSMRQQAEDLARSQKLDIKVFSDHQALLDAGLCDALIVASPNHTHFPVLCDVIATGLPILAEKPLATDYQDCQTLIKQAKKHRTLVWVAMEYRYMPPTTRLCQLAQSGELGDLKMFSIREHRYPFLRKVGDWNRFSAQTGGTMVEKCCHFFDLMRLLLKSDPLRIYASGHADVNHLDESYNGKTPDIIDNAYAIVDFANGTRALLDLCMFGEGMGFQETLRLIGSRGAAEARIPPPLRFRKKDQQDIEADFRLFPREGVAYKEIIPIDSTILSVGDHHGATYYQLEKFTDLVRAFVENGRNPEACPVPEVSLEDGAWAVRIGQAAELSARTGEAVCF